jgi:DNA-binding LacI/PurR family transcriptional regulator
MPTIEDVAREARVGVGTVSRVINGSPLVSEARRKRVLAAIELLGYRPSQVARAFGSRRTRALEVIVPLFLGPIFLHVLQGIQDALAENGHTLLLRTVDTREERDRAFKECCSRGRADGALALWLVPSPTLVDRVLAERFPVVLLNVADPRFWSVGVDHDVSAQHAVEYCAGLGHRRIALIDRREDVFDPDGAGMCERGYREAVHSAGLEDRAEYEQKAEFSKAGGAAALERLAELPEPPTAIVVASEAQAIGVLQAAREHGWRIPGDVSVVGYSDSAYAEYLGLTTIGVPVREIGREATRVLLGAIADPAPAPRAIMRQTNLLVRRTCGPPRN